MNEKDYNRKIDDIINEGIQQGKNKEIDDNILKELESFKSFLYWHIKNSPNCKQVLPSSHQAARFFATAKTHRFENINDITIDNLKLRPIIDQTGTLYYKTRKEIGEYLNGKETKSILFVLNLFCLIEIITSKFLHVSFTFKFMLCSVYLLENHF